MNTLSRCIQYDGGRMDEKILAYRNMSFHELLLSPHR